MLESSSKSVCNSLWSFVPHVGSDVFLVLSVQHDLQCNGTRQKIHGSWLALNSQNTPEETLACPQKTTGVTWWLTAGTPASRICRTRGTSKLVSPRRLRQRPHQTHP